MKKCGILACANPTPNIEGVYRIMQILGSVTFYPGQFRFGGPFPTFPLFIQMCYKIPQVDVISVELLPLVKLFEPGKF